MKKKTASISLSTILIIGLLVFLLLRSQNTNAATTASNASDENAGSDNASSDTAIQNPYLQEKDPIQESATNTGQRIGNHSWPTSSAEIEDAKAGWREAILLWQEYKKQKDSTTKAKYKNYIGYLIISVKDRGSKGKTFSERYNHLCWNQGDPAGWTNGKEWKQIWKNFSADEQKALQEMNSYAQSNEYIRWYQEMDK